MSGKVNYFCINCGADSLYSHFDGEQTYINCHGCKFDSLYGDGDQTEKFNKRLDTWRLTKPCCAYERRNMNGGCDSCGDPSF